MRAVSAITQGGFRLDSKVTPDESVTFPGDIYDGEFGQINAANVEVDAENIIGRWTRKRATDSSRTVQAHFDRRHRLIPSVFEERGGAQHLRNFPMELLKRAKIIAATALLLVVPFRVAPALQKSEYALKSVFVYNFCRFIDWPDSAFASPNEPLIIGVIGDDPFGSLLNEAVEGEKYHNRPIRIDHFRTPADIKRCHLLFISHVGAGRLDPILAAVAGKNVLTVSETEDFLNRGGMITLTTEQNRVRLRINPAALRAANLTVSSKLLRVAEITR